MNPHQHIRAVSFDVGGTLIEPWPSVGHVYAEVAARHGIQAGAGDLDREFDAAWRAKSKFGYTQAEWFELIRRTFGARASALPVDFFHDLYDRFAEADAWKIHDDVLPALDRLAAAGVRLAVISNWDARLHQLLPALRLRSYFDVVIVSCDVGFTKPSPVLFELALRQLGLPPQALLHVGDSQAEDVAGARAAGATALWLDRNRASGDGRIQSLSELERVVETARTG